MTNTLVINVTQDGYRIALLQDGRLIEYHVEKKEPEFTVGDIYLGTVKKVVSGMNAAFVDIGYKKDAFLHYSDLGPHFSSLDKLVKEASGANGRNPAPVFSKMTLEKEIDKQGKMSDVLTGNQKVLVQVIKEPISTKGPRLSCEFSLAGRYMILVPFADDVNISRKIGDIAERKRLFRLISSIKPKNFGVIVRTVAQGKEVAALDKELQFLVSNFEEGIKTLKKAKVRDKIIGEVNRASSLLRDILNEDFDNIVIDDVEMFQEIKAYISQIAPEKAKIVREYKERTRIFEYFGIERQIKGSFGQVVNISGGGYLVIEHTEALHVIDVNSGSRTTNENSQEETAINVNLAASKELVRQLRLRDMGGIIVVDFIDMKDAENRRKVYQEVKDLLQEDRAKTNVLPLSKLGLLQLTRRRVRPEMSVVTKEQCPTCGGTGQINASILVADQIEKSLHHLLTTRNTNKITLFLHPYVYAYFTHGLFTRRFKWLIRYKRWISLEQDTSLGITDYRFVNAVGEELEGEGAAGMLN